MEINDNKLQINISKAKNGNQSAFRYLLDTFWSDVYNYQLKRTKSENEAEDITIQTFSKAFDKINTFNEQYVFKTWLIAISKNVHIDLLRKKSISIAADTSKEQEEKAYLVVDESPTPEDKIITEQNLAKLLRDIKQLKPKYQEVIQLRYFQELSYKEISEQINEPMNNVKVKLLRARKLLAEIIRKS
ncbi:sigma-70 family RNA polymerase sigma factor [Polaribacter sp. Z014]|uniref:RNA polymerase sigma factor n=1 Tax=unclassified Polaribacter TaxID=196858 RepID=UPI00193B694E|nr:MULTISPECIES: sigma-70 family RNA polymerase sigma factor [unclassified Polaribacter]MCL7764654.1 sigma-70 family RNA polymerase sigma factor [Polaribacter sp. Z014]QVY65850.1 sigma-70 family RNA polymerase sigma factor [Polaribacter sp. Q13]